MATLLDDLSIVVQDGKRSLVRPDVLRIKLKEKLQFYVLDFIYNSPKYHQAIEADIEPLFEEGHFAHNWAVAFRQEFEKLRGQYPA